MGEYFFSKRWSIASKVKYTQNAVNYYLPSTYSSSGSMGPNLFGHSEKFFNFNSKDIIVPVQAKWEYPVTQKFHGYVAGGIYFDFVTDYSENHSDNV